MQPDYRKLGFMCGIEIHQQLDTRKLFCSCPSIIREDKPDVRVERRMRAVAGELGEVDPAALHEFLKDRRLVYEAYLDTNCLVELDEEPPHPLNQEALEIAVEAAFLLKARLVDELHVMRKTVIDGSNTTGFQRTILVAVDGVLETSEGRVGVPTICLEEDAARKIEENGDTVTYRIDRLGIPLIEVATTPDIKSPKHAREVAEKIGMLLRATGKVKRGLGTIRQDINVSISEGSRVEVKGVQTLNDIPKLLENEVMRQMRLVEIRKELAARGVAEKDLIFDAVDVSDLFMEHGRDWVKAKLGAGEKAFALKLKGYSGLLGKELMLDYRFGTELARIAKSTTGLGGIIHSDEGLDETLHAGVGARLRVEGKDGFVCVVAPQEKARKALNTILERCVVALKGVPGETRMAVGQLSEYMRPLPGSARMYPETDEPLVLLEGGVAEKIRASLPELYEEKARRYCEMGLSGELASQLSKSRLSGKFEEYSATYAKLKPSVIASVLLMAPKEAKKRFNADIEALGDRHMQEALGLLEEGAITKDVLVELFACASESPRKSVREIASEKQLTVLGEGELESIAAKAVAENAGVSSAGGVQALDMLVGKVMALCRGRADPARVREILSRKLKQAPGIR